MIDRKEAISEIRQLLVNLTGRHWSVRGGTGTAWGWINVKPRNRDIVWALPNPNYRSYDSCPKPWPRVEYVVKPHAGRPMPVVSAVEI